jgi:Regulator of chromosome condensation (RCC1) repeat
LLAFEHRRLAFRDDEARRAHGKRRVGVDAPALGQKVEPGRARRYTRARPLRIASILALSPAALSLAQTACRGFPAPGAPGLDALSGARGDVLRGARAISAGRDHTCALTTEGTVVCWGDDILGPLGTGAGQCQSTISAGAGAVCALVSDGSVACWGSDWMGEVANGPLPGFSAHRRRTSNLGPETVSLLSGVRAIAAGGDHVCALLADTTVECWGSNNRGQLGRPPEEIEEHCSGFPCLRNPRSVPGLDGVVSLSAGAAHTCAQMADGSIQCWGDHTLGQLGRACPIVARVVDQDRPAACGQELSFCADPAPVWPLPPDP